MGNRLDAILNNDQPILVCYLPVGDPLALESQAEIYANSGVDVFEIGLPCKHPYMDGTVVTQSMQRALSGGTTSPTSGRKIEMLRLEFMNIPIVVVGYDKLELGTICNNHESSIDGALLIGGQQKDWIKSGAEYLKHLSIYSIGFISHEVLSEEVVLSKRAKGYVMLQAASGKTGMRDQLDSDNKRKIETLKDAGVSLPILLGFGISTPEQARYAIKLGANGVIIGSACLANAVKGSCVLQRFLSEVRGALDAA